jgi:hypothetical protein
MTNHDDYSQVIHVGCDGAEVRRREAYETVCAKFAAVVGRRIIGLVCFRDGAVFRDGFLMR